MITTSDSLQFLATKQEHEFNILYADPPYALGSSVIVRPDGKVDYHKASDFMSKWEMPTGDYWEKWFKEAHRVLKNGGWLIMFGIDRQLLLFKYYALLAGFEEQQSLYWYFISNFPKATDLSKMLDKNKDVDKLAIIGKWLKEKRERCNLTREQVASQLNLTPSAIRNWEENPAKDGFPTNNNWEKIKVIYKFDGTWDNFTKEAEREIIGLKIVSGDETTAGGYSNGVASIDGKDINIKREIDITAPSTELAKKYDGYKYSISPLKQTNETIMIFKKPSKTGSVLHDTLAFENGDTTINVSALDIDGNRVGTEQRTQFSGKSESVYQGYPQTNPHWETVDGRYPAQTFIDNQVAEIIDEQSDNLQSSNRNGLDIIESNVSTFGSSETRNTLRYNDIGGASKILHKCNYEQDDVTLYHYEPKVSGSERNAGLGGFVEKQYSHDGREKPTENAYQRNDSIAKNHHPTLKPIELNYRILKLFKLPTDQKICYPFAGSGSEIIGGIKAGFENWVGCEINAEYVAIANARINYWKETMWEQQSLFDEVI
jgi:DNA modification methylase/transcriptional regulator with XRE-family HTH domain